MSVSNASTPFAVRKAVVRQEAAGRLRARVAVPVSEATVAQSKQPGTSESVIRKSFIGIAYVAGALLLHGSIVAGLMFTSPEEMQTKVPLKPETVVLKVSTPLPVEKQVETSRVVQPAVSEEAPAETVEPAPEPEPKLQKVVTKPARKPAKPRPSADPVDIAKSTPEPTPQRRVIGLSLSSTVKAGSGPAFAVGNTRMGKTDRIQSDISNLGKARSNGEMSAGVSDGTRKGGLASSSNKVATLIPTASTKFEKPKRLSGSKLEYPPSLKSRGIEGNVVVLIIVNENGRVQNVRIIQSSGYPEFDAAAKKAASGESYSPAMRDGVSVSYNLKYTYRFRIKGA